MPISSLELEQPVEPVVTPPHRYTGRLFNTGFSWSIEAQPNSKIARILDVLFEPSELDLTEVSLSVKSSKD